MSQDQSAALAQRTAWAAHVIARLKRQCAERAALPRSDGRHDVATCPLIKARLKGIKDDSIPCTCITNGSLSEAQLTRLIAAVLGEIR